MRFLTLLIIVLLAVQGGAGAQEGPAAPAEEVAPRRADEAQEEAPAVVLDFRDPFQSFLPSDVTEREEMEVPEWMKEEELEVPQEEVLDVSQFKVTGLVWGIDEARAIINDQILAVGDTIAEAVILRIDRDGILFGFHGHEYLLERNL